MRIRTETAVGVFVLAAIGVFLYMSFQIGALRFDKLSYNTYTVYFSDVTGLAKKAEVQIAGVKVGWVEDVELINNGQQVRAHILVLKKFVLHTNAYGIVRQDGLLGNKYLEVMPGDPLLPTIQPGGILVKPSKDPVAVDELMQQFKDIAGNIKEVTSSLKDALAGPGNSQRLNQTMEELNSAAHNIASFSQRMDNLIIENQRSFNSIVHDLKKVSGQLSGSVLPNFEHNIDRISKNFEDTVEPLQQVTCKINEGTGIIGQLVSDQALGQEFKTTIKGVRQYFSKIDQLAIIFDMYTESMHGLANFMTFKDAKGYLNVRIHPLEDYFYLAGVVGCFNGRIHRQEKVRSWFSDRSTQLIPAQLDIPDWAKLQYAPIKKKTKRKFGELAYNLQFGKIYDNVAFRLGLFESSFGGAIDFDIPFNTDRFRWISTLEAFDMRGFNRMECNANVEWDDRPHITWLNKVFYTDSLYFTFGADDFISRYNKNAFVGFGIRFADDDVKYLASKVTIPA